MGEAVTESVTGRSALIVCPIPDTGTPMFASNQLEITRIRTLACCCAARVRSWGSCLITLDSCRGGADRGTGAVRNTARQAAER